MSNPIIERWEEVLAERRGDAIYSPTGECLRTWSDIEAEARGFEGKISGHSVALQTGNHPSFPALLLACLRTGCPASLFDAGFFGAARSQVEKTLGVTLRAVAPDGTVDFEECEGRTSGRPRDGVCLYKLTSGTTALPQALGFTGEQLVADCDQVCATMGIRTDDLNFGVIAWTHSYGFSNLVTPLLCRGVRLAVATDPLPRAIESGLRLTGTTVFAAVPAMFRGLLSADSLPETLRLCISAGSLLDPDLARDFHEKFGRKIHAFYGASECGGISYDASEEIVEVPGFVGTPLQGVAVEIPDIPEGVKILVRSLAVGTLNAKGGFQPEDLLVREPVGFRIVGRESDVINVAGKKVNPLEIERALAQFPGVQEAVVCGVEEPSRGQEICALIAASEAPDMSSLRRHCAAHFAPWKVPRRFVTVPEIPRNARGKISLAEIARAFFNPDPLMFRTAPNRSSLQHDFDRIPHKKDRKIAAMTTPSLRQLKSRSQQLKPAIHLGKAGPTPEFLAALGEVLDRTHLVKLRFEAMKDERKTLSRKLAEITGSVLVQQVGHTAVFFRNRNSSEAPQTT